MIQVKFFSDSSFALAREAVEQQIEGEIEVSDIDSSMYLYDAKDLAAVQLIAQEFGGEIFLTNQPR